MSPRNTIHTNPRQFNYHEWIETEERKPMSRLQRAIEILEAINEHFQADAVELFADAFILEEDITIKDAIAQCLGKE